ncbi:hypothetical protein [Deinococcus koreensis]|uniref:Uncharacterized protein n=1 Tax=Deinococcus koreensis TaxID=2054903 RepID=A0A2K3UYG3_9DEIO|nr:hypothetical protein [Deinococcus koreensis]PNY81545.1 hypothetical protein CVO96_09285 [Deinococcus koreensis]
MRFLLTLSLALTGALQPPPSTVPTPYAPAVGGYVLLTESVSTAGNVVRSTPFLTDAQGHGVSRFGWLNRPLRVLRETVSAYVLSSGTGQVWLPKRNLQAKAAFPLTRTRETEQLSQALVSQQVYVDGHPMFPCGIAPGYTAYVTLESARVESIWQIEVSPQGGFVSGNEVRNQRVSRAAVLVMLRPLAGVRALAGQPDPSLQEQSVALMAQAPQRCTRLPGVFGSADDVYRSLSLAPLPIRPPLPNDPDAAQKVLIGWTRAQVLAQYGNPNEEGSLADLLNHTHWTFGYDYGLVSITFGPDGRVSEARIARSP